MSGSGILHCLPYPINWWDSQETVTGHFMNFVPVSWKSYQVSFTSLRVSSSPGTENLRGVAPDFSNSLPTVAAATQPRRPDLLGMPSPSPHPTATLAPSRRPRPGTFAVETWPLCGPHDAGLQVQRQVLPVFKERVDTRVCPLRTSNCRLPAASRLGSGRAQLLPRPGAAPALGASQSRGPGSPALRAQRRRHVFRGQRERPAAPGGAAQAGGRRGEDQGLSGSSRAPTVLRAERLQGCPTGRCSSWKQPLPGAQVLCFTLKPGQKFTEECLQEQSDA